MGQGKRASKVQAVFGYLDLLLHMVQGLLFVPMYLQYIGSELYGYWLASGGILVWLSIMDFGLSRVLVQRVSASHSRDDHEETLGYFVGALVLYAIVAAAVILVGGGASRIMPVILRASGDAVSAVSAAFLVATIGLALRLLNDCVRAFLTALLKPAVPMLAIIGGRVIGLVTIFLFVRNGYGIVGIALGNLVMAFVPFLVQFIYLPVLRSELRPARFRIPRGVIREYLHLAPSLVGSRIGRSLSKSIEPTIITVIIGPSAATMFSVTRRAGQLLSQGIHVLIGSSFPAYARIAGSGSTQEIVNAAGKIATLVAHATVGAFAGYVALNHLFVDLWVGSAQYAGNAFTLLAGTALLLQVFQDLLSHFVIAERRIVTASITEATESLVRLGLMTVFAAFLGISGPPLAMSLSTALGAGFLASQLIKIRPDLLPGRSLVHFLFSALGSVGFTAVFMIIVEPNKSWASFLIYGCLAAAILFGIALANRHFRSILAEVLIGVKRNKAT